MLSFLLQPVNKGLKERFLWIMDHPDRSTDAWEVLKMSMKWDFLKKHYLHFLLKKNVDKGLKALIDQLLMIMVNPLHTRLKSSEFLSKPTCLK